MGKTTGFIEYDRKNNIDAPCEERIHNFYEFHLPLNDKERMEQGARCMDCGVPFCQSAMKLNGMITGCPLHNLIPEWNDQIYNGHYEHAYSRLHKTSNFPEFTGRVCPALCEKACINGEHGDAVTIHDNELFVIETAFKNGFVKPNIPKVRSGKKVAVIGAGPAGLACADELNHRGHSVTVFEREDQIGGLLMYGIPNMKLDKSVILRRQKLMEEEGITFKTGVNVGYKDGITSKELLKEFDAIVLACGAKQPRALNVADPEKTPGVYYAVDFLTQTTKSLLTHGMTKEGKWKSKTSCNVEELFKNDDFLSAKGKHVVVVGGGDTGNDCIGTSIRHGCKSVTAIEMMPKPPETRDSSNPWPEWPKVLKTDYGHEEAISVFGNDPRVFETTIKEIHKNKDGSIKEVVTVKVEFDKDRKMNFVKGSEKTIKCDLLLIAAGFIGCEKYVADDFNIKLTARNTIETKDEENYVTSNSKVFAAGDMRRGQSLVVWAIAEGRKCACDVDDFLIGYTNLRKA